MVKKPGLPMRVAVVTPYYKESLEVLRNCHESVLNQTYECVHFLVADGYPRPELAIWPSVEHICLSRAHADVGNTPRGVGSLSAINQGFDAIAYLDADNWYYPTHIESMVNLHFKQGAEVCTATRNIHRLDGSLMYTDRSDSDGKSHVDTSCLFLSRRAFEIGGLWATMPTQLGAIGDRVIWQAIHARGFSRAHFSEPTVAFRTQYQVHYLNSGEIPPPGTKTNAESTGKADSWWKSLPQEVRQRWQYYFSTRVL